MLRKNIIGLVSTMLLASALAAPAAASGPSVRQLYVFSCSGGTCPIGESPAALLMSSDGNFYGVAQNGGIGAGAAGTIFKLTPDFQLTTLHTFQRNTSSDGALPTGLVEGSDGNLYGTTLEGGANNEGAIFRVSKSGKFRLLHSLCASCGEGAGAKFLVAGNDGNFYGDTYGMLFRITPKGQFTVVHTFDSATEGPDALGLVLASDGNLYGTTVGAETVLTTLFRLTPAGQFDVLQTFHYGDFPVTPPVQGADARLYGVLTRDSDNDSAALFRSNLSTKFAAAVLHTNNGGLPEYLMQSSNGTIWGSVYSSVSDQSGALTGWSTKGKLLTQILLDGSSGANPDAPLIETSDGTLIGIAANGGTAATGDTAAGTIFALQ